MHTTSVQRVVRAPRSEVYAALLDPAAVERWRVPDDMRAEVHEFEAREGGRFRVSLTYVDDRPGKSAGRTDTYAGTFTRLDPDLVVVETMAFESDDTAMTTPMTMTTTLADAPGGGCLVTMVHEGVPDVLRPEDNEAGMTMALDHLARYVEGG
jgi:uncharacterized protein YndB with AHSA1/START domain